MVGRLEPKSVPRVSWRRRHFEAPQRHRKPVQNKTDHLVDGEARSLKTGRVCSWLEKRRHFGFFFSHGFNKYF